MYLAVHLDKGTGAPDPFIEYMRSLVTRPIEYYTCFVSYSRQDQSFAERLYVDLQSKGVRCWFAPKELKAGDYYRQKIDESIRLYEKLLLVLSKHSVKSTWVEEEANKALQKEDASPTDTHVLFPIRLDETVMQTRKPWAHSLRRHRYILNFTGWKDHDQKSFSRLDRGIPHGVNYKGENENDYHYQDALNIWRRLH